MGLMFDYRATLVRVIDGDTIRLDLDLGFGLWRRDQSYRLARIDTPELGTPEGETARFALIEKAASPSLQAVTSRADKYGRFLVELFADGVNLNDWLVANGYAVYRTY